MKSNTLKIIQIILIFGVVLVIIAPYVLTRPWGIVDFSKTGQIGDTIGGITAPFASILGSLLVFYALKAQIDANKIIQDQIHDQKKDEAIRKTNEYLRLRLDSISEELEKFSFIKEVRGNRREKQPAQHIPITGRMAIVNFIEQEVRWVAPPFLEEPETPTYKYFVKLLDSIKEYIKLINKSETTIEDKQYFNHQIDFIFEAKIMTCLDSVRSLKQDALMCDICKKKHSERPISLCKQLIEIKNEIKNAR